MTHLVIQLKKVLEGGSRESVTSAFIKKLYNYASDPNLVSQNTDIKGDLSVDKTYQRYIDFLALLNDGSNPGGKYRDLDIQVTSTYIYFGDDAVESYWANTVYGDGIGITTTSAATITQITNSPFNGNTNIVSLDGMLYFTGVTTITNSFARDATNLVSFSCPLNLVILSECNADGAYYGAFRDCTSLTNVTLNEGLQKIANRAFMGCTSIQSIDIPSSVTHLSLNETTSSNNYGVFRGCSSLTTVTGGEGIVWIGSGAFLGCTNISSFPDFQFSNIRGIGDNAFWELPISMEVDLPSLTYLGQGVFKGTNITKIKSLGSITEINSNGWWSLGCFALCNYLTEVDLSTTTNLTRIGYAVFLSNHALTTVKLPSSLTTIDESAFFGCDALQSIDLSSCTSLGANAFRNCSNLTTVKLGSNLTTVGADVFAGCDSLTTIQVPSAKLSDYQTLMPGLASKMVTY